MRRPIQQQAELTCVLLLFDQSEDLFSLVEAHEGKELKLYVYSTDTDNCREVVITPNSEWGGEGRYDAHRGVDPYFYFCSLFTAETSDYIDLNPRCCSFSVDTKQRHRTVCVLLGNFHFQFQFCQKLFKESEQILSKCFCHEGLCFCYAQTSFLIFSSLHVCSSRSKCKGLRGPHKNSTSFSSLYF